MRFTSKVAAIWMVSGLMILLATPLAGAEEPAVAQEQPATTAQEEAQANSQEASDKYTKFAKMMTGAKMVGTFTIKGRAGQEPQVEEYIISECRRIRDTDKWSIKARIRYANKDYDWPAIVVDVKWVDDTPMITLTNRSFFGIGPFDARVLFYDGMYAGTWAHGDVGGHMYGRVRPASDAEDNE